MKLHEALRKVIRHFGVNVIEEKRLMSFLADYKAFDDYPAVKEVMREIATGDSGKKICLAADGSDEEFLRIASEIKETLVSEKSFKEEFARYAMDSVSFALGIVSSVREPSDHGYEAVRKNTGSNGSAAAQESNKPLLRPAAPQAAAPQKSGGVTAFVVSGDTWQTASDGAESHRRFYRGHDLTSAFDSGEFSRNVADGSFRDIFPGDYIIKKVTIPEIRDPDVQLAGYSYDQSIKFQATTYTIKFIIADLDIAMNQGSPMVTAHHAVILPDKPVFETYMNSGSINTGRYDETHMYKRVMPAFSQGLIGAFGADHLLKCSFDGSDRAASNPLSCTCRLMTLSMVFGQMPRHWYLDMRPGPDFNKDTCLGGKQLTAFHLHPDLQGKGFMYMYWLSDAPFSSYFAVVNIRSDHAFAGYNSGSSTVGGVRPFALLR